MSLLIAAIGSNHFGSMKAAKELIRVANEAGADLIKGQAYRAADMTAGSMPIEFYRHCQLSEEQYIELIHFARDLRTDLFFSIFSSGFERLKKIQTWHKMPASQTAENTSMIDDTEWMVVSTNRALIDANMAPRLKHAWVLYATDHMAADPKLEYLEKLRSQVAGPVGISDHTIGKEAAIKAVRWHNANCVEKHFTLVKDIAWGGVTFPDTIHGATPSELGIIAHAMH